MKYLLQKVCSHVHVPKIWQLLHFKQWLTKIESMKKIQSITWVSTACPALSQVRCWRRKKTQKTNIYFMTLQSGLFWQEREVNAVSQEIQGWPSAMLARPTASNPGLFVFFAAKSRSEATCFITFYKLSLMFFWGKMAHLNYVSSMTNNIFLLPSACVIVMVIFSLPVLVPCWILCPQWTLC